MASYTVAMAKSATLTGTTVDIVILLKQPPSGEVEVWNRSGAADISFRVGQVGNVPNPTDKGDDCFVVAAGASVTLGLRGQWGSDSIEVRIIGNGNAYTVTAG